MVDSLLWVGWDQAAWFECGVSNSNVFLYVRSETKKIECFNWTEQLKAFEWYQIVYKICPFKTPVFVVTMLWADNLQHKP